MAEDNTWKPGDSDNNILRKILAVSGGESGGTTEINNNLTNIDNSVQAVDNSLQETNTTLTTISGKVDVNLSTVGQQRGALTDGSGTITTGGASQQIFAANSTRKYFIFENVSAENLWIDFGTAAVANQPSFKVVPNGQFVMEDFFVSTQTVNVIGATTGLAFTAKQA